MKILYALLQFVSCTVRTGLTERLILVMKWKEDARNICEDHIPEIVGRATQNHDKPQSQSRFKCGISTGMPTSKQRFQVSDFYARSYGSRDSVVGIATGYRAGRPRGWSSSPGRVKNFLFSTSPRPSPRPTQPPMQWIAWVLSPAIKRPGREADHSSPTSAKVKKIWIYTSTPPHAFMAQCLIS
jgi:hypothetical protein